MTRRERKSLFVSVLLAAAAICNIAVLGLAEMPAEAMMPLETGAPPPTATLEAVGIPWPPPWSGPVDRPWTMYDGYWHTGWWIPGMISNRSYFLPSPQYHYGRATFYAEGIMEATAYARGMSLEGFLDGISLMSPADIGQTVWLRLPGREWEGPYLVVDCAQRDDLLRYIGPGQEAVEVGWTTAVRWGMVATVRRCCWVDDLVIGDWSIDRVYVFKGPELPPPEILAQHEPIRLAPWWLARAELEDFVDSEFWHPDPFPIQGQNGEWIIYQDGQRIVFTDFAIPEAFWPPEITMRGDDHGQ